MLAIIPARGGSKGLPGKNIKPLGGKPLISYTIEAALQSSAISDVIVSTDDEKIAEVSREHGARVPFLRPASLAQDDSPAIETYLHVIKKMEEEGKNVQDVVVLLPTSPLRNSSDIDNAVNLYVSKKADSVVSYTEEHHPIYWHKEVADDLRLIPIWEDNLLANRQALKRTYYPNGAIYVFRKELLIKGVYYTPNSFAYIMPRNRSVDIDTMDDFLLATYLMQKQ